MASTNIFNPPKKIREFDVKSIIGNSVKVQVREKSKDGNKQYAYIVGDLNDIYATLCGWIKPAGKPDEIITSKIEDAWIIEAANGGRTDTKKYKTYSDFFNEDRKQICQRIWAGGFEGRLSYRGNPDEADLGVRLDIGVFENCCFEMVAPEEWYSELYQNKKVFKFAKGFYKDADSAIDGFSKRRRDDLFGERYFPVITFPINKARKGREIAQSAKNQSRPIVVGNRVIFGTRCKPYEYPSVINATYKIGGAVPIGIEWNWD